jgi:hypothetical protein
MSDTFSERTTTSWGSRIGESIKGVLFGIVLIGGSIAVLFWNEGRAIQTARSLAEGGKVVVDVAPDQVDPAKDGRLIHVSGNATATALLADAEFGVSAVALHLVRIAEMYQWDEDKHEETHKTTGGSEETVTTYTYKKVWSTKAIDSANFRHPENHTNPPKKYNGLDVTATDAKLGAFQLDAPVLDLLPTNGVLRVDPPTADRLKPRIPNARAIDGRIYIGANPDTPQIGDYRISYVIAPLEVISVIGRQSGQGLTQYQTQAGDRLLMAVPGTQSATDMFKEAERENRVLTWIIRAVGLVVLWLGAFLILRPLVIVADFVPLIGSVLGAGAGLVALAFAVVVAPLVIAIAWLWYQPLVSAVVLVIGVAAGVGLHRLAARRSVAKAAPAAAA